MSVRELRRKPERAQAMQVTADNYDAVSAWLGGHGFTCELPDGPPAVSVLAGHRWHIHVGEWIVVVDGEFTACVDDDELAEFYEDAGREWWSVFDRWGRVLGTFDDRQAAFDAIPDYQAAFPNATPMRVQRVIEVTDDA